MKLRSPDLAFATPAVACLLSLAVPAYARPAAMPAIQSQTPALPTVVAGLNQCPDAQITLWKGVFNDAYQIRS
jgi:hypothetical protein